MNVVFSVMKPVLVKPLLPEEQEVLKRHGCSIEPFPRQMPELLKGHKIRFPIGTRMERVTLIQWTLYFPDKYQPALVVSEGWYHFYPARTEEGQLL